MIPHTIHLVWLNDDAPPAEVQTAVASWREHAPQFTVRLWTHRDVAKHYGAKMLATDYPLRIVSDLLRVHLLHEFGGVYLDADMFAQPGAGAALADICDHCRLFGTGFDGSNALAVDTVPMGAEAGLPNWQMLTYHPESLISFWNQYLAKSAIPPMILSGHVWNAGSVREGVLLEHRRHLLQPKDTGTRKVMRPNYPTIVLRTKEQQAEYAQQRAQARAKRSLVKSRDTLVALAMAGDAVEVGTHLGEFAEVILRARSGRLTCVDPWQTTMADLTDPLTGRDRDADYAAAVARLTPYSDRCTILRQPSPQAAENFADGSLALVYIDADHMRPSIDQDLHAWWPKVQPGGMLAGHDISGAWAAHVRPAVEEFAFYAGVTPHVTLDSPASWFVVKEV
jgi:predicted O-methyltransferase YrrM